MAMPHDPTPYQSVDIGTLPERSKPPVHQAVNPVELFGLTVDNTTTAEAIDWISRRARHRMKTLVNFVNAHCVNVAARDTAYRRALRASDRLLPDGSGIALAMRLRGLRLSENLNGTDLFPHLCRAAVEHNLSLYLLGAGPGVAQQVADNMQRRYPGLLIAGARDGYFATEDVDAIVAGINDSGADILLVAMGVPRQERWLAAYSDRLATSVNIGVGGLFDFYAERVSRAPHWLRRIGLEWTWRLLQEPGRMWRRYVVGNPVFIGRALIDALKVRSSDEPARSLRQGPARAALRRFNWWLSTHTTPLGKRAIDIVGASCALLLAAPLMTATALAIRLESRGPVLFSQQRVGLDGALFRLWKFRSMYNDAEARRARLAASNEMVGGVLFKMRRDPRVTRVGRLIRRLSIDELPQLWNVLRGDMALVGPRPALPDEVAQYTLHERRRLQVRPGITCIWQVSGRSEIPFARQVEMDLEYINTGDVGADLRLLLRTLPAVIGGQGAY